MPLIGQGSAGMTWLKCLMARTGTSASAPVPRPRVDAIMDRIIHNTIWVETGNYNMHAALASA